MRHPASVPDDLSRVDYPRLDQIGELAFLGVVAVVSIFALEQFADDDRTVFGYRAIFYRSDRRDTF
jgi:hypothetical protein